RPSSAPAVRPPPNVPCPRALSSRRSLNEARRSLTPPSSASLNAGLTRVSDRPQSRPMIPARKRFSPSRAGSVESHHPHLQAWTKRATVASLMLACALTPLWSAEEEAIAGFLLPVREPSVIADSAPANVELLSRTEAPKDTLDLLLMAKWSLNYLAGSI